MFTLGPGNQACASLSAKSSITLVIYPPPARRGSPVARRASRRLRLSSFIAYLLNLIAESGRRAFRNRVALSDHSEANPPASHPQPSPLRYGRAPSRSPLSVSQPLRPPWFSATLALAASLVSPLSALPALLLLPGAARALFLTRWVTPASGGFLGWWMAGWLLWLPFR